MSWEDFIASVSINEINTEVDYSSTAQTSLNDSRLRNLGRTLDNETEIEMKNLSFGLQLPLIEYGDDDVLILDVFSTGVSPPDPIAEAAASISLSNNGAGFYLLSNTTAVQPSFQKDFTWLKIGSAGDYEVKLDINSGDNPTGASLGTWLNLGTNRLWTWTAIEDGTQTVAATGVISIRRDSEVGPIRHFEVDLQAFPGF